MKIFIDTNIVLDVFLNRSGLVDSSEKILSLDLKQHELGVSLLTFTTGYYLLSRENTSSQSLKYLVQLRKSVIMLPASQKVLDQALNSDFKDFEDAIQYFTAINNSYEMICTRNVKDYKDPEIPVLTPEEVLLRI